LGTIAGSNGELAWIHKPFYLNDLLVRIQEILHRDDGKPRIAASARDLQTNQALGHDNLQNRRMSGP
jgi:DNA-binding response OmpR family regulator